MNAISRNLSVSIYRAISICLGCAVVLLMYNAVLLDPDGYVFSDAGDAIKNYFTFSWHVKYDPQWLNFQGTNYPYGEHIGYTDGHPILSLIGRYIPWVQSHPVGFLHLFLLAGIVATFWILYEILILWGCSGLYAASGAFAIYWLSPQIYRLTGHLALAHFWMLPGALLLFSLWLKKNSNFKWMVLLIIFQLFVYFIHAYPGFIISMFNGVAGILYLLQQWLIKKKWPLRKSLEWLLFTSIPPLAFYLFIRYTDHHSGRPLHAKGFLEYISNWSCIVVPNGPPFQHLMQQIVHVVSRPWEGWAYIGLATLLAFIAVVALRLKMILQWKNSTFVSIFFASFFVLLFSFGYPFSLGFSEWLRKMPLVEQFRAPGRFAWIFYFTSTISAFVLVSRCFSKSIWALLMLALFYIEGRETQWSITSQLTEHKNPLQSNAIPAELQGTVDSLQKSAPFNFIAPQPLWHYGSDYFKRMADPQFIRDCYIIAFHSGIPLMSSGNPRVSLIESRKILQFSMPDSLQADIINDLPAGWCSAVFKANDHSVVRECSSSTKKEKYQKRAVLVCGDKIEGLSDAYHILTTINQHAINAGDSLWAFCPIYYREEDAIAITAVVEEIDSTGNRWIANSSIENSPFNFQDSAWLVIPFVAKTKCDYKFTILPKSDPEVPIKTGAPIILRREK